MVGWGGQSVAAVVVGWVGTNTLQYSVVAWCKSACLGGGSGGARGVVRAGHNNSNSNTSVVCLFFLCLVWGSSSLATHPP